MMTFEVYFEIIRILLLNCDAMNVVSFSGKQCRWANVKDNGSFRQHTHALYIGLSTLRTNVNIPLKDTICIGTQR